jgi:hypothetical protein
VAPIALAESEIFWNRRAISPARVRSAFGREASLIGWWDAGTLVVSWCL